MEVSDEAMLTIEQLKSMNELEMEIDEDIMHHKHQVLHMKSRELADEVHVSTTTILRFCKKAGCNGFAEFKIKFQLYLQKNETLRSDHDISLMLDFFHKINQPSFYEKIEEVAQKIVTCDKIIFIGIGTSGLLGQYGARIFNNYGKFSFCIEDPFTPIANGSCEHSCIIALSVSGETIEPIRMMNVFLRENCMSVAITNQEDCTLARMCDYTFNYYMPEFRMEETFNVTTQVPVVFIIETLAKRVRELIEMI